MKIQLNKTLAVAVLGLVGSLFSFNSQAAGIDVDGSAGINNQGIVLTGSADLLGNITLEVFEQSVSIVGNTLDFELLSGAVAQAGSILINISAAGVLDFTQFSLSGDAGFGSFVASSASIVGLRTANFIDIFVKGVYNPGTLAGTQPGGCATGGNTCNPTEASLRWSFNRSGASVTGSSTLNSPAITIPEPATLGLLSLGLAGFAAARKKQLA